jgi:hypothetical protein
MITTLREQFVSLSSVEKRRLHFVLCRKTLAVWNGYRSEKKRISYTDSVVGCGHEVDLSLPDDAFKSAVEGRDNANVSERYMEPIVAIQDDDLVFPKNIQFAYFSIYNLFCKYVVRENIDDWIIINQTLSSETDETKWSLLLSDAMKST